MKKQFFTLSSLFLSLCIHAQVGVGTNNPNQALDIETNDAIKTAVDINNTSTGDAVIQLQINGVSKFVVGLDNSDGDKFKISTDTTFGTTPAITVDNTQNVGIGTSTPISGLDIQTSLGYKVTSISSATTLNNTYNVVLCNNGPYTITLPSATSNAGRVYTLKNIDTDGDDITIDGSGSETIDGATTYVLSSYKHSITIVSNGANWHIIDEANEVLTGTINSITCGSSSNNGSLVAGVVASGVSSVIPYTGGNGGVHSGQTVISTSVSGLTATLSSGVFSYGNSALSYSITGTPASSGTATFALNIGGQTCNLTRTVNPGLITALTCASATNNGNLTAGTVASGVNSVVPYTGGNAGSHSGQTVASTGVTGLTATLTAGNFANGSGNLTYTITGIPANTGTATFVLNIGGQSCILTRSVSAAIAGNATCTGATISATPCSAVANTTLNDDGTTANGTEYDWTDATTSGAANTTTTRALVDIGGQCWMRYDMNATPTAFNPVPAWLNGTDVGWSGVYTGGPYANEGLLYQWSAAMNNSTTERAQGVCPTGFHVPSDCEWMYLENTLGMSTIIQQDAFWRDGGAFQLFSAGSGNNSTGFSALMGGLRDGSNGGFIARGSGIYYWTSTEGQVPATDAQNRNLSSGHNTIGRHPYFDKTEAYHVRCLAD